MTHLNPIDATFVRLREKGEKGLIAYITIGDPDLATTREAVLGLVRGGADMVELGIPFSDPVADGPIIQRATERALAGGFHLQQAFDLARDLRRETDVPLLFMTYYNPVLRQGLDRFAALTAEAGVNGLLVPDLSMEESGPLQTACQAQGLHLIPFLAPTSTEARIAATARVARGFIYCVSLTGVTGARQALSTRLAEMVARIRPHTDVPLAAGFGIGGPQQAREAAALSDAVIVGSAIVERVAQGGGPAAVAERLANFAAELKAALRLPATTAN